MRVRSLYHSTRKLHATGVATGTLDAIAASHPPVGPSCSFVSGTSGVAPNHGRGAPADQAHEVVLLAPGR